MDDAALMRRLQRLADLSREGHRLVYRNGPASDAIGERLALDQLHDEHVGVSAGGATFEAVHVRDVRVVERGEHLGLARKACEPLAVGGERGRQDLDGDVALESWVARAIHLAHAACADGGDDLIRAEARAGRQTHVKGILWRFGDVRDFRSRDPLQFIRRDAEHGVRRAGGRPDDVELQQMGIHQHTRRRVVRERRDAADGVAGQPSHGLRIRPRDRRAHERPHFLDRDAFRSRGQHEAVGADRVPGTRDS